MVDYMYVNKCSQIYAYKIAYVVQFILAVICKETTMDILNDFDDVQDLEALLEHSIMVLSLRTLSY